MGIFKRNSRIVRKNNNNSILKDKAFIVICTSVVLAISLISTNIEVSKKTYEIIRIQNDIDSLNTSIKEINEELEVALSPYRIRKVAEEKLKMVDIENLEELVEVHP